MGSDTILVEFGSVEEYAANVAGGPPPNFNELAEGSKKLFKLACEANGINPDEDIEGDDEAALSRLQDSLLLASVCCSQQRHGKKGEHRGAFIQRAKQVASWCVRPIPEQTPLAILENKARELARIIARRLFHGDEFVLIVANSGEGGHATWISSMDRNTTIKVIGELAGGMKDEQKKRS